MNEISVNSVLAQIRSLSAQASGAAQSPLAAAANGSVNGSAATTKGDFGSLLKEAIDRVGNTQSEAAKQQRAFDLGDPNTDLSSVMLATSKAQVSFRGMVEVRNRLVSAYQDVMNMPL